MSLNSIIQLTSRAWERIFSFDYKSLKNELESWLDYESKYKYPGIREEIARLSDQVARYAAIYGSDPSSRTEEFRDFKELTELLGINSRQSKPKSSKKESNYHLGMLQLRLAFTYDFLCTNSESVSDYAEETSRTIVKEIAELKEIKKKFGKVENVSSTSLDSSTSSTTRPGIGNFNDLEGMPAPY